MKKLIFAILVMLLAGLAFAENQKWVVPPVKQVAVTASDSTEYSPPLVSMYVATAGTIRVLFTGDRGTFDCTDAPVHASYPTGLFRGRIIQVCATATTATGFVGYTTDP